MPETLTSAEWLGAVDGHYFSEYLPAGGSSVKFAVCYPGIDPRVIALRLRTRAERLGLLVADIDASETKVHMIEQIFGRIADQIPWASIVDRTLLQFARESQWLIPSNLSDEGVVEQLDRLNQLGSQQVSLVLQRKIGEKILLNRKLAKDFRVAMHWLARARLDAGLRGTATYQQLTHWLGGRLRLISEIKQYQIFSKVVRANARHLLGSLLVMIRDAGYPGLVVTLNGFRLLDSERNTDGSVNYTKAALFDAYEVFREFIDSTDTLDGLFLAVFVPPDFLDVANPRGRGIAVYPALLYRVYDELRGQKYANPLTALARISDMPETST
jgi:hypothetical protein